MQLFTFGLVLLTVTIAAVSILVSRLQDREPEADNFGCVGMLFAGLVGLLVVWGLGLPFFRGGPPFNYLNLLFAIPGAIAAAFGSLFMPADWPPFARVVLSGLFFGGLYYFSLALI